MSYQQSLAKAFEFLDLANLHESRLIAAMAQSMRLKALEDFDKDVTYESDDPTGFQPHVEVIRNTQFDPGTWYKWHSMLTRGKLILVYPVPSIGEVSDTKSYHFVRRNLIVLDRRSTANETIELGFSTNHVCTGWKQSERIDALGYRWGSIDYTCEHNSKYYPSPRAFLRVRFAFCDNYANLLRAYYERSPELLESISWPGLPVALSVFTRKQRLEQSQMRDFPPKSIEDSFKWLSDEMDKLKPK